MKKVWLALVLVSALFLVACGGGEKATDNEKDNTEETTNNNQGTTDNNNAGTTDNTDGTTDTVDEGAVAQGQEVVQKACITCHGQNLEGMGNFPALNDVGSRLSKDEILSVIQNGKGIMSANIVKGEDAEAAAAYLSTLK